MSYFSGEAVVLPSHKRNPNIAIRRADRILRLREQIHLQPADPRTTLEESRN